MAPEGKRPAAEIFADALELTPGRRDAFLISQCGSDQGLRADVEALLAAHAAGSRWFESSDVHREMRDAVTAVVDPVVGRTIGPYKVVRVIAEGGMGTVYLAERTDGSFERQVAVKLIRSGLASADLLRRFHNERQVLAQLEHPNIARLLDGGATADGVPYLVMEYVDGEPIDRHCARAGLDVPQRLALFVEICGAVHHAHQNLVVHRDLKPGNVLVDAEGRVKLLDFGIAKLLDPERLEATATTLGPWTPRYASPEQVRGRPVTTATDVYSLGVILYELLTGRSPYRLESHSPTEVARAICEQEPHRPSQAVTEIGARREPATDAPAPQPARLRQLLAGDLDTITLKALRKEPARRYASVEELADDVRRHLAGRTVRARPDTYRYRLSKFVRRNKAVSAALLGIILTLAVGLAVSFSQYREAMRRRVESELLAYESGIAAAESAIRSGQVSAAREFLDAAPETLRGWEWHHLRYRLEVSRLAIDAHGAGITDLALEPGSRRVASASFDRRVRFWNLDSGALEAEWGPFDTGVRGVEFEPGGRRVAVALEDGSVRLHAYPEGGGAVEVQGPWGEYAVPAATLAGRRDAELVGLENQLAWASMAFDATHGYLVLGRWDALTQVRRADDLTLLSELGRLARWDTTPVAVDPAGRWIATATREGDVLVWDSGDFERVARLTGHRQAVTSVAFSPAGDRIASGSLDGTVGLWDTDGWEPVGRFGDGRSAVRDVVFDAAGRWLFSAAGGGRIAAHEAASGALGPPLHGHEANVYALLATPDGRIVSGDWAGQLRIWSAAARDVTVLQVPQWRSILRSWANHAILTADGAVIGYGRPGTISWPTGEGGPPVRIAAADRTRPRRFALSPDGRTLAVGYGSGRIEMVDLAKRERLHLIAASGGTKIGMVFLPGGDRLATVGGDGVVRVWSVASGEALGELGSLDGSLYDLALSADGRLLAGAAEDGRILLLSLDGSSRQVLDRHGGPVEDVAFAPDRPLLASASSDGTVRLWRPRDAGWTDEVLCRGEAMYGATFSPDGSRLAVGGERGVIRLFEPSTGREKARLYGHAARVLAVEFGPYGRGLVSTSLDRTIRVWNAAPPGARSGGPSGLETRSTRR
jgi:serine/threonine protein kinase/WD40 repeat protein